VVAVVVVRRPAIPAVRVVRVAVARVEPTTVPVLLELSILVAVEVAVVSLILVQLADPVLSYSRCKPELACLSLPV
jgi:hypothetical protein